MAAGTARLLVLSSLFPSAVQPAAGTFIRERMFRVARQLPIVVLAPQAWFPLQGLIRRWRPHFRPMAPAFERMDGIEVHRPRFLSFPGVLKRFDGLFMALCCLPLARRLVRAHGLNVLDAHFAYPDGYAGLLLKRWLGLPMVLTLRGKEERQARTSVGAPLRRAILGADRLVAVSDALRELALGFGADPARTSVIGNGIDLDRFHPVARDAARSELGLPDSARVLVSVGTLVERKGFHRVISCLPQLRARFPDLRFLVVGGAGPEGDIGARLREQVRALGLETCVQFLGAMPPERLRIPLSAADVFVLATSYEGWANVLLEAMACGLPVVTTRVGGNEQVVPVPLAGCLVPFGDPPALAGALEAALVQHWDRAAIIDHARANAWERRIPRLLELFGDLAAAPAAAMAGGAAGALHE
jgi:glycosyltransferase involved in cell wall biosynthesis